MADPVKAKGDGSSSESSFTVSLHPLVIMNISDHHTRIKVSMEGTVKVFGALFGTHEGRNAEICDSFELVVKESKSGYQLDVDYFVFKREQFKQVFPNLEFLGWYTNCEKLEDVEYQFHQQLCQENESYLLLTINPFSRSNELPITVYESLIDIVNGQPKVVFSQVSYVLATEEAERVGVDHIAKETVSLGNSTSAVTEHLTAHHGAIKMLHTRIKFVLEYLKGIQAGHIPKNHSILREVSSLCNQLPIQTSADFNPEHSVLTNDIMLISYLATITKGCSAVNNYVQKLNTLYDHHGILRRARGSLF